MTSAVFAAALLAAVFPSFGMNSSASEIIYAKTTDALNLRSGPGIDYSVSGVMSKDTSVAVLDVSNKKWIKVKLSDGKIGYCSANYVDITADAETTDYVNLRSGPGTENPVIKTIDEGTKLDVITYSGSSWAKVKISDGTSGYINTNYFEYVTADKPSEVSKTSEPSKTSEVSETSESSEVSKTSEPETNPTEPKGKITLSTTGRSLAVGNIFTLTASGNKSKIQWYTSDSKVAVVGSSGAVSGIAPGEATIRAVDSSIGATAACMKGFW